MSELAAIAYFLGLFILTLGLVWACEKLGSSSRADAKANGKETR